MVAVIGLLLVIWLVVAVLGLAVKGLLWLFVVGLILFLATGAYAVGRRRKG